MKKVIFFLLFPIFVNAQMSIHPIYESEPIKNPTMRRDQLYRNWGIKRLKVDKIHRQGFTGKGIKICICDTGRPTHKDLINSIVASKSFSFDKDSIDGNGHGTHVAGIINEIAPNAEIYTAKVLSQDGIGTIHQTAEGINWCISKSVDVVNLSLGGFIDSMEIKFAIDLANTFGIKVICAAGNDGIGKPLNYPARYNNTVAVGSIDNYLKVSYFSWKQILCY